VSVGSRSISWKGDSPSDTQEFLRPSINPTVHYRDQKS